MRTTSAGSWWITSPTVSGEFVGVAPMTLKGDIPAAELIGGAAIGSLPAVLKSGLPPTWKGDAPAGNCVGGDACMEEGLFVPGPAIL